MKTVLFVMSMPRSWARCGRRGRVRRTGDRRSLARAPRTPDDEIRLLGVLGTQDLAVDARD
jgi:hypothetical protein